MRMDRNRVSQKRGIPLCSWPNRIPLPYRAREHIRTRIQICNQRPRTVIIMIRLLQQLYKFKSRKIAGIERFRYEEEHVDITALQCPVCAAKGCLVPWEPYGRDLILPDGNGGQDIERVRVRRVLCTSCGHTHALLPQEAIPFGSYSISFVLDVLQRYFRHWGNVEELCMCAGISHSKLYVWKHLFLTHKRLFLGLLRDGEISTPAFCRHFSVRALCLFLKRYHFSFLRGKCVMIRPEGVSPP